MNKFDILKRSPSPGFMFDITGHEISLVGHPANRRNTLLTKSLGENTMEELLAILKETEVANEDELVSALEEEGVSEKGIEVAKAIARFREAYGDELSDEGIAKALRLDVEIDEEDNEPVSSGAGITKSDLKELDENTREHVEKAFSRIEELEKTLEERDRESRRDAWLSRAENLDHISVDADKLADRLVKIEDALGRDEAEDEFSTLEGANEVAKDAGVFQEKGSSGSGSGSTAYDEVVTKAEELMKDSDLRRDQAISKVLDSDSDLRNRFVAERS